MGEYYLPNYTVSTTHLCDLEVAAECYTVVEHSQVVALVVAGLEVDSECHAVVEGAQLGPALEVAGEHHTVVECTLAVAGLEVNV